MGGNPENSGEPEVWDSGGKVLVGGRGEWMRVNPFLAYVTMKTL